jgi:shikimate kinase
LLTKQSIVLIGMAGAGKSTIGASLAAVLSLQFIDLDVFIREKENCTIQEIVDKKGESALLALEEHYMYEVDLKNSVVAPGGSIVYRPALMKYLKNNALLVYLEDSFEDLEKRIKNASSRGIVGLKNKTLRQIFEERKPLYSEYADFTINMQGKSRDQVVNEIAVYINLKIGPI